MNITDTARMGRLIAWANRAREIGAARGMTVTAKAIQAEIDTIGNRRFILTIMGKGKRGKSTLVNALLGRRDDTVAPIDKLPASSAITRYFRADRESVTVSFRDGHKEEVGYSSIRSYVTEELNPENTKQVESVDVLGPFPGLDSDLVLADTPGAGSIHEHHDQILHSVLPQSDAVLFLVTADSPLDRQEVELLARVKAADIRRFFFVINKADTTDPKAIEEGVQHNRRVLTEANIPCNRIYQISANDSAHEKLAGCAHPKLAFG